MKLTIRIPNRSFMGWVAYIAVAVTIYAYFTVTSIPMITYILLGSIMAFSFMNGTLGEILGSRYSLYTILLVLFVLFVHAIGVKANTGMTTAIVYQLIVCLSLYIYLVADRKGIDGLVTLIAVAVLILCVFILSDERLLSTLQDASEVGVYYSYEKNNRNTIGIILSFGALCMMHLGLTRKRWWFVGMVLAAGLGTVTGSRKAVITVFFGAIIYVFLYGKYFQKKDTTKRYRNMFFVLLAACLMMYACFEVPTLYNIVGVRIEGLIGTLTGTGETEASASIRAEMVEKAMEMFLQKPLFGWGIEGFALNSGYRVYSHNNFMETLVSFGIFGFVLFYAVKLFLIWRQFVLVKEEQNTERISQHIVVLVFTLAALILDYGAVSMNSVVMNLPFAMAAAEQYYNKLEKWGSI